MNDDDDREPFLRFLVPVLGALLALSALAYAFGG